MHRVAPVCRILPNGHARAEVNIVDAVVKGHTIPGDWSWKRYNIISWDCIVTRVGQDLRLVQRRAAALVLHGRQGQNTGAASCRECELCDIATVLSARAWGVVQRQPAAAACLGQLQQHVAAR
jgi:hypothetical protein